MKKRTASAAAGRTDLSRFTQWWNEQDKSAFKGEQYKTVAEEIGAVHSWCKAAWLASSAPSSARRTAGKVAAITARCEGLSWDQAGPQYQVIAEELERDLAQLQYALEQSEAKFTASSAAPAAPVDMKKRTASAGGETEQRIVEMIRYIGVKAGVAEATYGAMCHEARCILRSVEAEPSVPSSAPVACAKRAEECWPCVTCGAVQPSQCAGQSSAAPAAALTAEAEEVIAELRQQFFAGPLAVRCELLIRRLFACSASAPAAARTSVGLIDQQMRAEQASYRIGYLDGATGKKPQVALTEGELSACSANALTEQFKKNLAASEADLKEKLKPYEDGERASRDIRKLAEGKCPQCSGDRWWNCGAQDCKQPKEPNPADSKANVTLQIDNATLGVKSNFKKGST